MSSSGAQRGCTPLPTTGRPARGAVDGGGGGGGGRVAAQAGGGGGPAAVHAVARQRHAGAALDVLGEGEGVRCAGQGGLDVAGLLVVPGGDVVRDLLVDPRPRLPRGVHPDDDRQLLVADGGPRAGAP